MTGFDANTGTIRFADGAELLRGLTLATFLASPLAARSEKEPSSVPFDLFLLPPREMDGRIFGSRIDFRDGVLEYISLSIVSGALVVDGALAYPSAAGWDTWTLEAQLAQKARHDAWLLKMLGPPTTVDPEHYLTSYELPWGGAQSSYDPRSDSSSIGIRYKPLSDAV